MQREGGEGDEGVSGVAGLGSGLMAGRWSRRARAVFHPIIASDRRRRTPKHVRVVRSEQYKDRPSSHEGGMRGLKRVAGAAAPANWPPCCAGGPAGPAGEALRGPAKRGTVDARERKRGDAEGLAVEAMEGGMVGEWEGGRAGGGRAGRRAGGREGWRGARWEGVWKVRPVEERAGE